MPKLEVTYLPISEIEPYAGNAKLHPEEQVQQIADSIEAFGFNDPIAIDGDGTIIEGHGRYLAAKKLGLYEVPIIRLDHMTEEEKRAYIIAHNKLTLNSGFDTELLEEELRAIVESGIDAELTGFDEGELRALLGEEPPIEGETDPDIAPSPPERPVIHFGDLIEFPDGSRIICGDSTSRETFRTLMGDEKARMVFTDPPYGVSYESDAHGSIANDDLRDDGLQEFLLAAFKQMDRATIENPAIYCFYASRTHVDFETAMTEAGWTVKQQIIWVKNQFAFGRSDYHWKHEPLLYAIKEGSNCEWFGPRTQTTVWRKEELADMTKEELLDLIEAATDETTAWEVDRDPGGDYAHPTQKPVRLAEIAIRNSSREGEIVLEPFSGSGSTLIAAVRNRRRCYAVEFEPKFVQVAVQRYVDYFGEPTVKINGSLVDWEQMVE